MQAMISRHPSLENLKYINDVSHVSMIPSLLVNDSVEHIYHELIRINHSRRTSLESNIIDIDEDKENRPPLLPMKCHVSRIPIRTTHNPRKIIDTAIERDQKKKSHVLQFKTASKSKSNLSGKY
jgi:hypothetical protein